MRGLMSWGSGALVALAVMLAGAITSAQVPSSEPVVRPALPDDATSEVKDLDAKIEALREAFLKGESDSLEEAIAFAERLLAIRLEYQGPQSQAGS